MNAPLRALSIWAATLATIETAAIALSVAGFAIDRPVALLVLASGVAAGIVVARALPRTAFARLRPSEWPVVALWVFVATLYAGLAVAAWFKPDMSWDGLAYHSPTLQFWHQRGRVAWIGAPEGPPPYDWRWYADVMMNGFPKGVETVGYVVTVAAGTGAPANAYNLFFLPLGALGVASLASMLGATRAWAAAGAAFWLLVPVNVTQTVTTYIDASYGSCVVAWFAAMMAILRATMREERTATLVPALGGTMGLALGAKALAVFPVAFGLLALGANLVVLARRRGRARVRGPARAIGASIAIGAVVAAYWYARNWLHRGSPIYPVQLALFGVTLFDGQPLGIAIVADGNLSDHLRPLAPAARILSAWTQGAGAGLWPASIRFYDARDGGLGFTWILCGVPAILLACAHAALARPAPREDTRRPLLAALLGAALLAFLATPAAWWARYTLWVHGAGLPVFAAACSHLAAQRARVLRIVAALWIAGGVALATTESAYAFAHAALVSRFWGEPHAVHDGTPLSRALTEVEPSYFFAGMAEMPLMREALASGAPIAVGPTGVPDCPVLGVVSEPIGARAVSLLSVATALDEAALHTFVAQNDVAWIIWSKENPRSEPLERMAARREEFGSLWTLYAVDARAP